MGSRGGYAAVRPKAETYTQVNGRGKRYAVSYVTTAINRGHRFPSPSGKEGYRARIKSGRQSVPGRYFYEIAQSHVQTVAEGAARQVAAELREHSHHPEKYYGQSHFLPSYEDGEVMLWLNRVRTTVRQTELAACEAWPPGSPHSRQDIIQGLNRLSSLLWIQMIRLKAGKYGGTAWKQ